MQNILRLYYNLYVDHIQDGYFYDHDCLYYIFYIKDVQPFLEIYYCYRYEIELCGLAGYTIVENIYQEVVSQNCIVLKYQQSPFDFMTYLNIFLQPLSLPKMKIIQNKERWIQKIDCVKAKSKDYAYSFKHDQNVLSLIYYYCGLAENSITILNHILSLNQNASVSLCLSLKHPIHNRIHELLNPAYYVFSSQAKHLTCLLESGILNEKYLTYIMTPKLFNVYEMLYFYARFLYSGTFFNHMMTCRLQTQDVQYYYQELKSQKQNYEYIYRILSNYIRVPKISWLYDEFMV